MVSPKVKEKCNFFLKKKKVSVCDTCAGTDAVFLGPISKWRLGNNPGTPVLLLRVQVIRLAREMLSLLGVSPALLFFLYVFRISVFILFLD